MNRSTWVKHLSFAVILAFTAVSAAPATEVAIDFGDNAVPAPTGWNSAHAITRSGSLTLKTTAGSTTGYSIVTVAPFNNDQPYGTKTASASLGFPVGATADGIYGNINPFQNFSNPKGAFEFRGLNPAVSYGFRIFASVKKGTATPNRDTQYSLVGATTSVGHMNPTNNDLASVSLSVKPNSAGVIRLDVQKGSLNNTPEGFYHIASLRMIYTLPATNTPPIANAGGDKTITTNTTQLSGTASDSGGSVASVLWTKTSGGAAAIANANTLKPTLSGLATGVYVFNLKVTDNGGLTANDSVKITVNLPTGQSAPTFTLRPYGSVGDANATYGYVEYLPRGYTQATAGSLPVIIFMHGIGEMGEGKRDPNFGATVPVTATDSQLGYTSTYRNASGQSVRYLNSLLLYGPNRYIRRSHVDLPFVVLSIQKWEASFPDWDVAKVDKFVTYALSKYKINKNRLYMTGLSLGGGGSLHYTYMHPERVAALLTVCPGYYNQSTDVYTDGVVHEGVGVWAAHAHNDTQANFHTRSRKLMNHMASSIGGTSSDLLHYLTTPNGALTNVDPKNLNMATYMSVGIDTATYNASSKRWSWVDGISSTTPSGQYPVLFTFFTNKTASSSHYIWDTMYDQPSVYTWMLRFSK